jgi:hypothetical protein
MAGEDTPPGLEPFIDAWNERQNQTTPVHHAAIAGWLSGCLTRGERNLLLMAFRGAGKSTVVGLLAAWLLLSDPCRRLMVIGPDLRLAKRMVRNTQRIIESHPATEGLKPGGRASWSAEEFTVVRERELRDPSMVARGILGNITGSRADVVICDDVEVPRTADTAPKREALREKLSEIDYVLTPGGTQLYVGTPHSPYSIYAEDAHPELGEAEPFLEGFGRFILPVWDEAHAPAWPERFTVEHIERIRRRSGPHRFAAQMLLRPMGLAAGRLDPDRLRPYDAEPVYREAMGRPVLTLGGVRLLSASCWWDPAFGRTDEPGRAADGSVVAAVYGGEDHNLYLHRVVYLTVDPGTCEPEAEQQCRAVAELARSLHLPGIRIETNGIGSFLPGLLREAMGRLGVGAAVSGLASHVPKDRRILEALDAPLAAGRLFAHRSVWATPLIREMREWRPGGRGKGHDDGLDAVAGAVAGEPQRFDRPSAPGDRPGWRAGPVTARADWDV